jgi:hypothetical protein
MSVLFDSRIFIVWCVVKDVDREVAAVMIALESSGFKQ